MSEIAFSSNHRDLSRRSGTDSGFQFEFRCNRCSDGWRSRFEPYTSGQAAGWLQRGAGMAGQLMGRNGYAVRRAADGLADAGWGKARDQAFTRAVESARQHFHRCPKCTGQNCAKCWNVELGLCLRCAPDTATEVAAARVSGLNREASKLSREAGEAAAANYDIDTPRQLVCPSCSAETRGGRFCMACGHQLADPGACGSCQATVPAGAAFCPGCGTRR
jgi:rubrerythrin